MDEEMDMASQIEAHVSNFYHLIETDSIQRLETGKSLSDTHYAQVFLTLLYQQTMRALIKHEQMEQQIAEIEE